MKDNLSFVLRGRLLLLVILVLLIESIDFIQCQEEVSGNETLRDLSGSVEVEGIHVDVEPLSTNDQHLELLRTITAESSGMDYNNFSAYEAPDAEIVKEVLNEDFIGPLEDSERALEEECSSFLSETSAAPSTGVSSMAAARSDPMDYIENEVVEETSAFQASNASRSARVSRLEEEMRKHPARWRAYMRLYDEQVTVLDMCKDQFVHVVSKLPWVKALQAKIVEFIASFR